MIAARSRRDSSGGSDDISQVRVDVGVREVVEVLDVLGGPIDAIIVDVQVIEEVLHDHAENALGYIVGRGNSS